MSVGSTELITGVASECGSDHCVTCSDEAVPLRVDEVRDDLALCAEVEVMTDLVGAVEVGDVLLVHAGVAIARADGRGLDGAGQGAKPGR
jgi:hypothetical protein